MAGHEVRAGGRRLRGSRELTLGGAAVGHERGVLQRRIQPAADTADRRRQEHQIRRGEGALYRLQVQLDDALVDQRAWRARDDVRAIDADELQVRQALPQRSRHRAPDHPQPDHADFGPALGSDFDRQ
jgi:hypothetical protein